jgi:hypothetical protein
LRCSNSLAVETTKVLAGAVNAVMPVNATITFMDTAANQDACKNAVVTLNSASI